MRRGKKLARVDLRLELDEHAKLKADADKRDTSMMRIARVVLRRYLKMKPLRGDVR